MTCSSKQPVFLFFGLVFLMFFSGCSPVVWTPTWSHDSKTFFYTQDDGSVLQYNLDSKSGQTLIKFEKGTPTRVAISPDDRWVAIAMAKTTKVKEWDFSSETVTTKEIDVASKGHTIELTILQLSDSKVVAQKTQAWGDPEATQEPQSTNVYWCPSGKRVLICYDNTMFDGPGFAVYDVESETLTEMNALMPDTFTASFFCYSPIVPDGSGYLAVKSKDTEAEREFPEFYFVDWEGKEHLIENTPSMKSFWTKLDKEEDEKREGLGGFSTATWNDNVLTVLSTQGGIHIDPKRRMASVEPLTEDQQVLFKEVPEDCLMEIVTPFPHSSLQVRWYSFESENKNGNEEKLVLFAPGTNQHQTFSVKSVLPGLLSPDGKHMLVPVSSNDKEWIYVIRDDGTMVAKVEVEAGEKDFADGDEE